MCNTRKQPTQDTINRAFEKARTMGSTYTIQPEPVSETAFYIRNNKTGARYRVDVCEIFSDQPECNCPAFEQDGFCKHCAFCIEEYQIRQQEKIEELKDYARWDRDAKY